MWSTFGIVLTLRYFFPPEPVEVSARPWRGPPAGPGPERGWRSHRPPTPLPTPVSEVPADLWRLQIEIGAPDVETLRGYFWNRPRGGQSSERPEVLAIVREGGQVYSNVALNLKGAAGSFRPFDDKPALTLSFSKHVPGQRFHGYSKVSLNNSVQDPSYLCEAISRELFEAAGVPAPRADHVTVLLNGRDLGLYVLTEGWGKPFLRRHFANVSGNLYDGGFVQDITGDLNVNSGDYASDRSDVDALLAAAGEPDPARRLERLTAVLDLDRFLSFLAMEILTCHWDGYALNRNNYRLFHDLETDRMVFLPHGMDQMFGVFRSSPESPVLPPVQGLVAHAFMTTPGASTRYFDRVTALRDEVFVPERLTNRVHELSRRIRPTLAAYGSDVAERHDREVAALCERILARAQSITEQLAAPRDPLPFDANGVGLLSDWTPRPDPRRAGEVQFEEGEADGRAVLRVLVGMGGGAGGWRTHARLEAGSYRFEGQARTRGVGLGGQVSLRLAAIRDPGGRSSDEAWSEFSHHFTVYHPLVEIEFLCELRAAAGEAWFDRNSLRIVRN